MSKYARIIDIEKLLYRKGFCIGKTPDELYEALSDLPTIEVSEELLKATKKFNTYTIADENAEMGMRTQIEPIIEVSEDCISREWVLEEYQKGKEKIGESEFFAELMWLVKHAPRVIPIYQPITIKADEKALEPLKKQLKDIKTVGTLMAQEEYGLSSVVPSRAEGEWIVSEDGDSTCSVCGASEEEFIYGTENWYGMGDSNYCPACGAKMKGESK